MPGSGVDGGEKLLLFHHIEPRNRAERRADGDDVNGNEIHPRSPLGDRLHADAKAEADDAEQHEHRLAAELWKLVQQRFRYSFKHVLERADARENHGDIEDDRKKAAKRNVLQYGRKRYEKEPRARADVQPVGKARGNNNERRDHGGDRIKERRVLRHADDVFVLGEIRAVNDHAAARDGQGEKRLPHGPDPDHRILERLPARGEHELIALG